jgi:hypothetical protein
MKADVKGFVQNFARFGMGQRPACFVQHTDPNRRTEHVRQLGVEAVAKALRKQGIPERGPPARLAS